MTNARTLQMLSSRLRDHIDLVNHRRDRPAASYRHWAVNYQTLLLELRCGWETWEVLRQLDRGFR